MTNNKCIESLRETIGLIPAGGQGARIGPLPSTKLFRLVQEATIAFGFPDIFFETHDTFV